jgi:hypothetical protein
MALTLIGDEVEGERARAQRPPDGCILPGLCELMLHLGLAAVGLVALLAGCLMVGWLCAWLLAEGPAAPASLAPLVRRTGIAMGLCAWTAGVLCYWWGRWARHPLHPLRRDRGQEPRLTQPRAGRCHGRRPEKTPK